MTQTPDITIIGGGIIGMLSAREFFNAGASVAIIDKNRLGQESSWAGGGILLPLYPWRQDHAITQLALQSLKLYPALAGQLLADTGLDPEWTPCGMLITKNPDIAQATDWCATHRIRCTAADATYFDTLNTEPDHPLWLADIAQARNPRLVKSLKQDLINKGITIHEGCELTAVNIDNNRITRIKTTSGANAAHQSAVNQLVIAGGAWTGGLFQKLFANLIGAPPQIAPIKGQMLLFDAQTDTLRYMVLDGERYLIPRRDGKILVGSTVEQDEFNKATTSTARDQLSTFALELLPALGNFPLIKHWAGLRPGTEHGIPYIGRHPEISNLSINAGHFRNGLVMGPASAQLLVDLMLGRATAIAPEPYQTTSPH
ncbi:MAG: FAD-dependent oxidoreductase [Methylovulum sp.]|nr:FAD-dependent oxidoreductase [Methylovulum sp.]